MPDRLWKPLLDSCLENNITDWGKIKTEVKDALGEYLGNAREIRQVHTDHYDIKRMVKSYSMDVRNFDAVHSDEYQEYQPGSPSEKILS